MIVFAFNSVSNGAYQKSAKFQTGNFKSTEVMVQSGIAFGHRMGLWLLLGINNGGSVSFCCIYSMYFV